MIKNVAIVSLSSGIIGEDFVRHEVEIGVKRLENFGMNVRFMPHAMKGIEYVKNHPKDRAADLLYALKDPEVEMILCAIGGDDTYRLLPYTRGYFEELIRFGTIREVRPSSVWYEERTDFGVDQIGVPLTSHPDSGFVLLQGSPLFSGKILGGCIDTLYDFFNGDRYADMPLLCQKYGLFPKKEDWVQKILLLESSEEKMPPSKYEKAVATLKETGIFEVLSGVLVGKPMDETYAREYRQILTDVIDSPDLPIVWNVNIGHAQPRCILPFGVKATVDVSRQVIRFAG